MALDTTYSDLILMIGGQVLLLFILGVLTVFGVDPIVSPSAKQSTIPQENLQGALLMLGKVIMLPVTAPVMLVRSLIQWLSPQSSFLSFVK